MVGGGGDDGGGVFFFPSRSLSLLSRRFGVAEMVWQKWWSGRAMVVLVGAWSIERNGCGCKKNKVAIWPKIIENQGKAKFKIGPSAQWTGVD